MRSRDVSLNIEDRYLIKSCERATIMELHACVECFLRKYNWTENSDKAN